MTGFLFHFMNLDEIIDPCQNGLIVCGANSQCKDINGIAACSCLPGFNGSPPDCISGCVSSSECDTDRACINHTCVDPCTANNGCGLNTNCTVLNHSPFCSCLEGFAGDPLGDCFPTQRKYNMIYVLFIHLSFHKSLRFSSKFFSSTVFSPMHNITVRSKC